MKELCSRCTICCYRKVIAEDGSVVYTDRPCGFLDLDTGLCIVYEFRTRAKAECVRITKKVVDLGALPSGCPYVKDRTGYRAPRLTPRLEKLARETLGAGQPKEEKASGRKRR
jgi:uncharacterized cysteine cluster protein YcgN (CxxCxxCC family)